MVAIVYSPRVPVQIVSLFVRTRTYQVGNRLEDQLAVSLYTERQTNFSTNASQSNYWYDFLFTY